MMDNKSQEAAFKKLSRLKCGALFMEMGTGKTKVALDLMASKKKRCNYYLWICPFSTKGEIEEERKKWHPELNLEIIGVETLSQSDREFLRVLRAMDGKRCFLVVDESLKIKNREAKRTSRVMQLGRLAEWRLVLNGTPLSKNVLDLWTQMQFLSPKILKMSYNEFKNNYCEYYVRGKLKNRVKAQYNIPHLISLIRPYIFDSELDLGLSKKRHEINYSIEDLQGYSEIKNQFLRFDSDISFFSLATSLQQHYCVQESKKDLVENLIKSLDGQVVVFVKYLGSIPDNSRAITGDLKAGGREKIIKSFKNGDFKALYLTYGCGAFGLNLQNCKNAIFADHTFDYAERLQAEARIFRLGQESDVDYYDVNCDCGLDRLVRGCLGKKTRLLDEVKREIEKKGVKEWLKSM